MMLFISTKQSDMSLLSLLKRSSQFGGSSLSAGSTPGQNRIENTQSEFAQAEPGSTFGGRTSSDIVNLKSGYQSDTAPTPYAAVTFQDKLARRNQVVDYKAKTYIRPGNFQGTIGTYADRIFAQQSLGPDQFAQTPINAVSTLSMSIPILTPTTEIGTSAGMPFDDGRYLITVGYGFVLYGTLTNGGYA